MKALIETLACDQHPASQYTEGNSEAEFVMAKYGGSTTVDSH